MLQDKQAIIQVLGSILKDPTILSESNKYKLTSDDFPSRFHSILFFAMSNLFHQGTEVLNEVEIDGYLKDYDIQYKIFHDNKGLEYIERIQELAVVENFDYHYKRLKKFSLLREMDGLGFDIKEIYDESLIDPKEQEKMQEQFDKKSIDEILTAYEMKIVDIKEKFRTSSESVGIQGGEGINELLDSFEESPDIGVPLNSEMLTSIFRGSRKKKFYLRSSITGGGKTRNMVADACRLSATELYDPKKKEWVSNPWSESSTVISTEMMAEELQSLALAYISGVEEKKILRNTINEQEKQLVRKAAKVLQESNIWFEHLPDFNIQEIERTIEKNVIKNNVEYVYFDYIHSSVTIFSEMSKKSGVNLREDQILLLMSDKLKGLCNKYDVYMMSATQLNGDWKEAWLKGQVIDASYLRGSKAIADKTDAAMIILPLSKKEKDAIDPILKEGFYPEPNFVTHVFKNRGNEYDKVKVFSHINMGNMRIKDCFTTNLDNELITVEKLNIKAG
ncbi:replicative DNA helicase [Bacillus stercoris]|uniref:replicative DNA helicase n=1 Tax=Bacillus stercoris TaxID=2054641 RepID=UPI001FB3E913|nr:replicative DNA helicase [Bacillus stercoris]